MGNVETLTIKTTTYTVFANGDPVKVFGKVDDALAAVLAFKAKYPTNEFSICEEIVEKTKTTVTI
jgi:hypothetical protein